jgi:hypothetical protein
MVISHIISHNTIMGDNVEIIMNNNVKKYLRRSKTVDSELCETNPMNREEEQ